MNSPILKYSHRLVDLIEMLAKPGTRELDYAGVYVLALDDGESPVYVGQGASMDYRLKRHVGAILTGDFCYWNVERLNRAPYRDTLKGLVREVPEEHRDSIYEPLRPSPEFFKMSSACEFLSQLTVWSLEIARESDRTQVEGYLIRHLAGESYGGGGYLLANGNRSAKPNETATDILTSATECDRGAFPEWWPRQ